MKTRRFILSVLAAVAGVIALSAFVVWKTTSSPKSPLYEGHTVEYWLGEVFTATNQGHALQVLRQAGPEAAAALVRALELTDSSWRKDYAKLYPHLPAFLRNRLAKPVPVRQMWSAAQLTCLNNPELAKAAIPGLIRLLDEKHVAARADVLMSMVNVLREQDQGHAPAFLQCLHDTNSQVRIGALFCLEHFGASADGVIPAVKGLLQDADAYVRVCAVSALWKLNHETNAVMDTLKAAMAAPPSTNQPMIDPRYQAAFFMGEVDAHDLSPIPVLIEAVKNRNSYYNESALFAFQKYGHNATDAVPALVQIIEGRSGLRTLALQSLKAIDPAAAEKYQPK